MVGKLFMLEVKGKLRRLLPIQEITKIKERCPMFDVIIVSLFIVFVLSILFFYIKDFCLTRTAIFYPNEEELKGNYINTGRKPNEGSLVNFIYRMENSKFLDVEIICSYNVCGNVSRPIFDRSELGKSCIGRDINNKNKIIFANDLKRYDIIKITARKEWL